MPEQLLNRVKQLNESRKGARSIDMHETGVGRLRAQPFPSQRLSKWLHHQRLLVPQEMLELIEANCHS